jgi:hypothetical protein
LKYLKSLFSKLSIFRRGLARVDNHPIGKATLAIVIMLDIFILVSITDGLGEHTAQLVTPHEYIPPHCSEIVISNSWDKRYPKPLADLINRGSYGLTYDIQSSDRQAAHSSCLPVTGLIHDISMDKVARRLLANYLEIKTEIQKAKVDGDRVRSAHDSVILETIAGIDVINQADQIQNEINRTTSQLNRLLSKERDNLEAISTNKKISALKLHFTTYTQTQRDSLKADKLNYQFWLPLKRLGMEMIFLLPMILILFLWNGISLRAGRHYQVLVSSHLIVIAFIPTVFRALDLIYTVIPKTLIAKVITFLESFNLIAIWYYIVMAAAVSLGVALIYFVQLRIFTKQQIMKGNIIQDRIAKGCCQDCGNSVHRDNKHCSACGYSIYSNCSACDEPTYTNGKFCKECGAAP